MLTAERAREVFEYEEATGRLTWRVKMSKRRQIGQEAGCIFKSTGYRYVGVDGHKFTVHRVVWLMVHGAFPSSTIDHINGDRADNRLSNLRDVPHRHNSQNQRRPHEDKQSCKLIGATWDKMWRNWKAQIGHKKKTIYIGRFKTAEEAHAAYLEAKRRIHACCTI
jgi:hypothetical protein